MTEQSDVRAAAERLIAEAAIAEREMLHMYSREHRPDYLTVAHAALEAVNDRARLLGEVERLRAALESIASQTIVSVKGTHEGLSDIAVHMRWVANNALDAAPAVAPGASDAGDGDRER